MIYLPTIKQLQYLVALHRTRHFCARSKTRTPDKKLVKKRLNCRSWRPVRRADENIIDNKRRMQYV